MSVLLLLLIIIYVGAIPGIIYGGYIEKKGVPAKAIASFTAPDGTKRQVQMDVSWSWTVFAFRGWALAFRGQFMPFLIVMITSMLTMRFMVPSSSPMAVDGMISSSGLFNLIFAATSGEGVYIRDWLAENSTNTIILKVIGIIIYLGVINYYVAFANRDRIKAYAAKGFDFSSTPNLATLYEYIGHIPRTPVEDLAPNVKPGQTHDYVVPDVEVKAKEEEADDYSMLTMNDLKLLLKSEGIPFSTSQTKEELLKLVDKHISKKKNS